MVLRPDELSAYSDIQHEKELQQKAKGLAKALGTATLGAGLGGRLMPFLNQYIPADLAMKGINRISPKLGSFLKKGERLGLDIEEGLEFFRDQLEQPKEEEEEEVKKTPSDDKDFNHIHQFIEDRLMKGHRPRQIAALLKQHPQFKKTLPEFEKSYGMDIMGIIDNILQNIGVSPQQEQQQQAQGPIVGPEGQSAQPQGPSPAMQNLLQTIQQIKGSGLI